MMRMREDLLVIEFDPDLVIYDEAEGECHVLMGGAVVVWAELEAAGDALSIDELVERICDGIGAERAEIDESVGETVESLRRLGLLIHED